MGHNPTCSPVRELGLRRRRDVPRRATTRAEFFTLCREFLDHDHPMSLEPFPIALKQTDVMAGATR